MYLPIIIISVICVLFIIPAYSEDTDYSLSSVFHDYKIKLFFSDGIVKGSLINNDQIINLDNIKVIERRDRVYIIDKENNLKIFSKKISDDKHIVLVKTNDGKKLRFITDSDNKNKNIGQRNLLNAMEEKQTQLKNTESKELSFREQQLLEKQKKLEESLKKFQGRQNKINEQKEDLPNSEKTKESILKDFEKSKTNTGMQLVTPDKKEEKKTTKTVSKTSKDKIKAFLSVPPNVTWKKELKYDVLVTDDSGHRYNANYKTYVGNEIENAVVSGKITNPSGKTIHQFNGTTDFNGKFFDKFLVPDNSITRGEYTVSVNAVNTFKDKSTAEVKTNKAFFVFPISKSSNYPPIANAGMDRHLPSGIIVTLDGSNSTDPDDTKLYYTWTQTNGTTVTLSDNKSEKPFFTIPNNIFDWFDFSLIVNDGRRDSLKSDIVTITSLHADTGLNQTHTNGTSDFTIGATKITLDGSKSGDALGHVFSYLWSMVGNAPPDSTITIGNLTDNTIAKPEFTPDQSGNYTFQLDVTDGIITDTDIVNIEIKK